jgi:hypothetical protein
MILNEKGRAATRRAASRAVIAMLLSTALATCGGGADNAGLTPDGRGGAWNVVVSPTALTIVQGQTATATVSIVGNAKGTVSLSLGVMPDSVTATLGSPALASSSATSTLSIRVAFKAGIGPYSFDVHGKTGNDSSAVSIPITVTAAPGMTVTRAGSGSGTVTSDPAGINCGSLCNTQFPVGTSVTLSATPAAGSVFASWAGACTGAALTCTFTPASNTSNSVTATFNTTAPGIGIAVSPTPVSVQQGTSANATVTITRNNGFANPVAITTSAASGLTVTPNPASVTGTTSALTISAAGTLPVGNYPVTITATASGVTQQTVTLPVQVMPASQGAAITFNFANCETSETPVWLAVQSGTGPWTRVTATNNAFTFTPGATGAVAYVTQDGPTNLTQVLYASAAEFTSLAIAGFCTYSAPTGTKRLNGTFVNTGTLSLGNRPKLIIGGATFAKTSDFTQAFTFTNAPKGTRDLIGTRQPPSSSINSNRMIVRRSTNYPDNAAVPLLDFGGAESFLPASATVTISNFPDTTSIEVSLVTANGSSAPYFSGIGNPGQAGGSRALFQGLPDTLLLPGDFHAISMAGGSGTSFRFVQLVAHSVSAKTTAFGPQLGTVTKPTTIGTTPYLRLRAQVPTQSTYTSAAALDLDQNNTAVSVVMTAAYLSSTPTTWTLDVPDLSSAGYDATWGLKSGVGVSWSVNALSALNGILLPFLGGTPVDNAQITGAGVSDSSATFSASWRRPLGRPRR